VIDALAGPSFLTQTFEQGHEAFVLLDAGGAVAAWSPAAERLFGYTTGVVVQGDTLKKLDPTTRSSAKPSPRWPS
jgi:PAS domain S-box-containing protein